MASSFPRDRRRSTPLPRHPSTEADFRSATEAMQRAAEAMFAATASFRRQLAFEPEESDLLPLPHRHPLPPPHRNRRRASSYQPPRSPPPDVGPLLPLAPLPQPQPLQRPSSSSRHQLTASLSSSSSSATATAANSAAAAYHQHNPYSVYRASRVQSVVGPPSPSSSPSFPSDAHPPASGPATHLPLSSFFTEPLPQQQQQPSLTHTRFLPADPVDQPLLPPLPPPPFPYDHTYTYRQSTDSNGSQRLPLPAPPPHIAMAGTAGRRPSTSSYIDLMEAASRLKRPHASYQGLAYPAGDGRDRWSGQGDAGMGGRAYATATTTTTTTTITAAQQRQQQRRNGQKSSKNITAPLGFSLAHEAAFVLLVCVAQMLMLAGIAQALVPAGRIGASFAGTRPGDRAWYTAAYGLTAGTCVLPAGRLGDVAGHRRVFVAGFVWFGAWSLAAGCAALVEDGLRDAGGGGGTGGTTFFIVARAMQGVGPALLVPNGQAMLGRAYAPGPRKNLVMSLFGASAPAGFVAGAAMASLCAERVSWPWAFWTMAAVCLVLAAVSLVVMPRDGRAEAKTEKEKDITDADDDDDDLQKRPAAATLPPLWVRMDGSGTVLGVAGLVLVNVAFNQAPLVGWTTPYTYFLLVIGVLLLGAFAYVEAVLAACPLVPRGIFHGSSHGTAGNAFVLGCTATGWGCFAVWVAYAVQMFETLRGWSPLRTSAAFAPAPVSGLAASLLTGRLLSRGVAPHAVMLASMLAFFAGSLLFATAPPRQHYWLCPFFSIAVMPFGMDMSNPAATILLSNSVARGNQGAAASLVVTFVNYAISLALGIAGSVEAAATGSGGGGGATSVEDNLHTLLAGYRAAQYFGLGLGGLGVLLAAAFLYQSSLRKALEKTKKTKMTGDGRRT